MGEIKVVIIGDFTVTPSYMQSFLNLTMEEKAIFEGFAAGLGEGMYSLSDGDNLVIVRERRLNCQRHGKTEEEVAELLKSNPVKFSLAAEQLGLYKTELNFWHKTIYVCATPSDELNRKLRGLMAFYFRAYSHAPYAVFSLRDMIGDGDGNNGETLRAAVKPSETIMRDYEVRPEDVDKKIERAGHEVLKKNLLFGSILLSSAALLAANDKKT